MALDSRVISALNNATPVQRTSLQHFAWVIDLCASLAFDQRILADKQLSQYSASFAAINHLLGVMLTEQERDDLSSFARRGQQARRRVYALSTRGRITEAIGAARAASSQVPVPRTELVAIRNDILLTANALPTQYRQQLIDTANRVVALNR